MYEVPNLLKEPFKPTLMKTTRTSIIALSALLTIFTLHSCKKKSINCGVDCDYSESIVFNFGFENVTIQQDGNNAQINGVDSGFSSYNSWDEWDGNEFGNLSINYEEGNINQRHADIIVDPADPANHVLEFSISEPHINEGSNSAKARVQLDFGQTKCLREIHEKCRLYLPSNSVQTLQQYDELVH